MKNAADRALIKSLQDFARRVPPPARVVLISCDGDFASQLVLMSNRGYHIVVIAYLRRTSRSLFEAADAALDFKAVLRGRAALWKSSKKFKV